jgi:uncharacterized protein
MAQVHLTTILSTLREQLPLLADRYAVQSLGVFGSNIRNEQRPDSDLDLLVTFYKPPSLIKYIELEQYLSDLLGVSVDLVMQEALKPNIGRRIQSEVVSL